MTRRPAVLEPLVLVGKKGMEGMAIVLLEREMLVTRCPQAHVPRTGSSRRTEHASSAHTKTAQPDHKYWSGRAPALMNSGIAHPKTWGRAIVPFNLVDA